MKVQTVDDIEYRVAYGTEWDSIMDLAWRTFLKFEAPEYSEEGIKNFRDFVTDETLFTMFKNGYYQVFVAVKASKIVGMISLRNTNHISLLFVDEECHRQGIGRGLISTLKEYMYREMGQITVTVNAAPYAEGFYHKVGFRDIGEKRITDGIIYTPMELII